MSGSGPQTDRDAGQIEQQSVTWLAWILARRQSNATTTDERARAVAVAEKPDNLENLVERNLPTQSGYTTRDVERILGNQNGYSYKYRENNGETILNAAATFTGSMLGRAFMYALSTTTVFDADKLKSHIWGREPGHGLLTVSNHKSVMDDPCVLAALTPWWTAFRPKYVRWGTCASDICFRGEFREQVMRALKTLPIVRFGGLRQQELDQIVHRLYKGDWVNYYAEGRVSQPTIDRMRRGVGKIICQAGRNQFGLTVIPIYHEGLEHVMPQDENAALVYTYPRVGKRLWAIAGDPINFEDLIERSSKCKGDECLRIYEEAADRCCTAIHLLRAELRRRAASEYGEYLGDPYEPYLKSEASGADERTEASTV